MKVTISRMDWASEECTVLADLVCTSIAYAGNAHKKVTLSNSDRTIEIVFSRVPHGTVFDLAERFALALLRMKDTP